MKSQRLKKFKALLEEQIEGITKSVVPLKQVFSVSDDDRMDEIDAANADVQRQIAVRLHERHGKFSEKVLGVAKTFFDGSFGICRACNEEIDVARLLVRPMTVLCVDCKCDQEREERRRPFPIAVACRLSNSNVGEVSLIPLIRSFERKANFSSS